MHVLDDGRVHMQNLGRDNRGDAEEGSDSTVRLVLSDSSDVGHVTSVGDNEVRFFGICNVISGFNTQIQVLIVYVRNGGFSFT